MSFKPPTFVMQNCNITEEGWKWITDALYVLREKYPNLEVRIEYCNIGVISIKYDAEVNKSE